MWSTSFCLKANSSGKAFDCWQFCFVVLFKWNDLWEGMSTVWGGARKNKPTWWSGNVNDVNTVTRSPHVLHAIVFEIIKPRSAISYDSFVAPCKRSTLWILGSSPGTWRNRHDVGRGHRQSGLVHPWRLRSFGEFCGLCWPMKNRQICFLLGTLIVIH